MGFSIPAYEAIGLILGIPTSVAAPIAACGEKSKNPIISTTSKIVQIIPSSFLLMSWMIEKTEYIYYIGSHVYSSFNCTVLPVGITLLAMPILIPILQKIAKNNNWIGFGNFLAGFEKVFTTMIKTMNIASVSLGFYVLSGRLFDEIFKYRNVNLGLVGLTTYLFLSLSMLMWNFYESTLKNSGRS